MCEKSDSNCLHVKNGNAFNSPTQRWIILLSCFSLAIKNILKHTPIQYILQVTHTHTHRHSIKPAWKVMHTWVINSTQYLQIYLQPHFEGAISLTFKVIWKSWYVHTLRLRMSVCSSRPRCRGLIPEMTKATDQKQGQTWDLSSGALGSATQYFTVPPNQHFKWHRHNLAACCQDYLQPQDLTLTVRLKAHRIFLSFVVPAVLCSNNPGSGRQEKVPQLLPHRPVRQRREPSGGEVP